MVSNIIKRSKPVSVLTTDKERNSNFYPWKCNGQIRHYPIDSDKKYGFNFMMYKKLIKNDIKLVSLTSPSFIDGSEYPLKEIIEIAHDNNSYVLVDAQLMAPYSQIDVKKLDIDFLTFTLDNMCGPSGIGILYGKEELLESFPVLFYGEGNISPISFNDYKIIRVPEKFEIGTYNLPSISCVQIILEYLEKIGMDNIDSYILMLCKYFKDQISHIEGITYHGLDENNIGQYLCNFSIKNINSHDIGMIAENVGNFYVRTGMMCSQPWFLKYNFDNIISLSFQIYNSKEEIDNFIDILMHIINDF